jgi:hypothetical protein
LADEEAPGTTEPVRRHGTSVGDSASGRKEADGGEEEDGDSATDAGGEESGGGGEAGGGEQADLDSMTVAELRDVADTEEIDLSGHTRKDDIIKTIKKARRKAR